MFLFTVELDSHPTCVCVCEFLQTKAKACVRRWRRVRRSVRQTELSSWRWLAVRACSPLVLVVSLSCFSQRVHPPRFPRFRFSRVGGGKIRVCSSQRAAVLGKEKKKRGVECEDGACGTSLEAGPAHAAGGDEDTEHTGTDVGRTQRDHNVLGGMHAFFLSRPNAVITTKFRVPGSTHISSPNPPPVREARGKTARKRERERERETCCHQRR